MSSDRMEYIKRWIEGTAFKGAEFHPLAGDASFRRYIRLHKNGESAMLMDAPPDKEDVRPFISVAEYLVGQGYSAPRILAKDVGAGLILLEDLGDDSFSKVIARDSKTEEELYASAMDVLAEWHDEQRGFSSPAALPLPGYDEALLMREVALFSDWYLPKILGEKTAGLREEYLAIWREIIVGANLGLKHLVHRDYHADNLMWLPGRTGTGRVGLLDFQDGVYGDVAYDIVSLLEDARRDVPAALADKMLARYIAASGVDKNDFMSAYAVLGAQRNSKIIGIFTRLAVRDGKAHYLKFLPRVWGYLERDLAHPNLASLKKWLDKNVPKALRGNI